MANPKKGEASFSVGTERYTLRFSMNVLCSLEEELGRPLTDFVLEWGQGKVSISVVRQMIRAALVPNHPDISLEKAGDLMDEAGMATVLDALTKALNRSAISDEFNKGESGDPQNRTGGTGTPSSTSP